MRGIHYTCRIFSSSWLILESESSNANSFIHCVVCAQMVKSHFLVAFFVSHVFQLFLANQLLINHIQYNIRCSVVFPFSLPALVIAVVEWPLSYAN